MHLVQLFRQGKKRQSDSVFITHIEDNGEGEREREKDRCKEEAPNFPSRMHCKIV